MAIDLGNPRRGFVSHLMLKAPSRSGTRNVEAGQFNVTTVEEKQWSFLRSKTCGSEAKC